MKKIPILSFLIIHLFSFSLYSQNEPLTESSLLEKSGVNQNRIEKIDLEILRLKKEMHELGLEAMKAEVESEDHMKFQWKKYTDDIEKAENYDQQIQKLQDTIKALKAEKKRLLINQAVDKEAEF